MKNTKVVDHKNQDKIKLEIDKLTKKKKDTTLLFSLDEINYDTFKDVLDSKLEIFNKELESLDNNETIGTNCNEELIKEVIVNLKNNFIHLNNHEKKMFLERFIKEIRVEKVGDTVVI